MTSVIFNDPSGSDFLYKFSGVQLNAPSGETLALGANANTADNSNAIVTVGESYIRIPQGVSNERPSIPDSYVGMMRYLTTSNLLEYFNGKTNTWIPVSLPAPTISSISPNYISFDASGTETNSNTYTLTGSNFNNEPGGISVEVIGNNGTGTILVPDSNSASSEISATFTFDPSGTEQLIGISNELPFAVKLTNTNSGSSSTLNNAIIATNAGPEFTQPSVFTPSSFQTFPVQDPCANFIVGGIDFSTPPHPPLTFTFVSGTAGGFNTGGVSDISSISDFSSIVQVPAGNRLDATASSYNFTMRVTDASNATSDANYTLSLANPTISSINPSVVNKANLPVDISINGNYFIRDTNIVLYNQTSGISAEFTDISYNSTTSLTINDLSSNAGTGVYDICVNNFITPYQFFSSQLSIWENATITGGTSSIGYTDACGNGFTTVAPYSDGYTVYIFTSGSGITFDTPSIFPSKIDYLVVGGGGGGGAGDANGSGGGGGGAGGYLTGSTNISTGTTYTLSVGAGGTGRGGLNGNNGGASSISGTGISLSAAGGGGGAQNFFVGNDGASGGGGGLRDDEAGGTGNTPSTTPAQGYNGGNALFSNTSATGRGGGGGGALAPGDNGSGSNVFNSTYFTLGQGGDGGSGKANNIAGSGLVYYAGGGGAGSYDREAGRGGLGGGGLGADGGNTTSTFQGFGQDASANSGGGGGGSTTGPQADAIRGGNGGSGIIVLRHLSYPPTYGQTSFLINGGSYSGTPISGTYTTYPGYNTGTNTTPGTATVTYVDANGANPVSYATGPYAAGYTIVTFLTTTPVSPFTTGSPRPTPQQVLYYANTTDFTFQGTSPFPAQVEYLIVAGGGTGAKGTGLVTYGGGGGGGEVLYGVTGIAPGVNYDIKIGSGAVMDPNGSSSSPVGGGDTVYYNLTANGANSEALGLIASGGQGGNGGTNTVTSNNPAGTSGIGGTSGNGFFGGLNTANSNNGTNPAGGGGGAAGCGRPPSTTFSESGGQGIASQISGTNQGYGAGGGGGGDSGTNFNGGSSPAGVVIGGRGGSSSVPTAGVANTGSGGGGMRADDVGAGGGGGTGIIILKFPSFYGF